MSDLHGEFEKTEGTHVLVVGNENHGGQVRVPNRLVRRSTAESARTLSTAIPQTVSQGHAERDP